MDNWEIVEKQQADLKNGLSIFSKESKVSQLILDEIAKLATTEDWERSVNEMLASVGSSLCAERIYIFEEKSGYYPSTYEWCAPGVRPGIESIQNITKEELSHWIDVLEKGKCIFVPDVEGIKQSSPSIYEILARQKIKNVIGVPIMMEGRLIGFLGVDNVPDNITKMIADSLAMLGSFLGVMIQLRIEREKIKQKNTELEKEKKRYREALSNNCEYCYSFDVTEGMITESFVTVHGVNVIEKLGLSLPVSYDEMNERYLSSYEIEMISEDSLPNFTSQGLLEKYNNGVTNVVTEYYSPMTGIFFRLSALLSMDEETGHVHAVIIANEATEDRKNEMMQLYEMMEAKELLSTVNEELMVSLKSEKEKTEIIYALSNIYCYSYLLDLKERTIEEVSNEDCRDSHFDCEGTVEDAFSQWAEQDIEDSFQQKVREFVDLATLSERMEDNHSINLECISKSDGWIRASFIVVSRDDEGDVAQVLWAVQRIDREKKKELAQQEALKTAYEAANRANAAKTNFLASMSHDIRTPMNAIIGMTAIAGAHLDDKERVADCLGKITVSSKHLLGLINEVLDMTKIESGKVDLQEEEFNLSDLIDNLLNMVRPLVRSRKHELEVTISKIEHENVIGDSQRLQQVFMNLMGNAIKYTPDGGRIRLFISEKPTNKPRVGCYEFIFEDNGIGMSKEFQTQLFRPFTRAEDSRAVGVQGTGLGMAISNNIVQMMNGKITVESELDKGTKITVLIVMKLHNADEEDVNNTFVDLPILVCDDDRLACESTCEVVEALGMKSEWVLSGKDAVDRVAARHDEGNDFYAAIIDWKMPGMDGVATTKEIRRKVGNEMPIIIISAYDWSDIELEARAAGASGFISKPLFKSRVENLFNELLGNEKKGAGAGSLDEVIHEDFKGRRALLVEDNELNAEIAKEILEMAGLSVDCAEDGKKALDIMTEVADDYYDIVFMDIQMPVMDGYDAATAIRALPRDYTKRVPIIAMTANAFTEDVHAAINAGMNQHMAKPLNFNQLMDVLRKWLG